VHTARDIEEAEEIADSLCVEIYARLNGKGSKVIILTL